MEKKKKDGDYLHDLLHFVSPLDVQNQLGLVQSHAMLSGKLICGRT